MPTTPTTAEARAKRADDTIARELAGLDLDAAVAAADPRPRTRTATIPAGAVRVGDTIVGATTKDGVTIDGLELKVERIERVNDVVAGEGMIFHFGGSSASTIPVDRPLEVRRAGTGDRLADLLAQDDNNYGELVFYRRVTSDADDDRYGVALRSGARWTVAVVDFNAPVAISHVERVEPARRGRGITQFDVQAAHDRVIRDARTEGPTR